MSKRIVLLQGHPDPIGRHYGHALAEAYASGAAAAGHTVERIEIAHLEFTFLRSKAEWESATVPAGLREAQTAIGRADHVVLIFPLWLGTMPALVKAFLEQVLRPGFALAGPKDAGGPPRLLRGKSARVIVTMGMPAFWYRLFFFAHGVKGLERNVLSFCGLRPIRETFIGLVEGGDSRRREQWLVKLEALGRAGA